MSLDKEKFKSMRNKKIETFDDDFGTGAINETKKNLVSNNSSSTTTTTMDIDKLKPFSDYDNSYNQFDYSDERFEELMKSIETTGGIIEPLIVWETDKKEYIILSGKHRWLALKKLSEKDVKYKEVPIVLKKDLDIDEAVFIFNTSNMTRRSFESMNTYQKAASLSQIAESYKKIVEKKLKVNPQASAGGKVTEQVGKQYGLSGITIMKYIKLYKVLKKDMFSCIDEKLISLDNAYLLCSLDKALLKDVFDMIKEKSLIIDTEKAKLIKEQNEKGIMLDIKKVITICNKKKAKSSYSIKVKEIEEFDDFFKNKDDGEIENTIKEALKEYIKNHK